MDNIIKFEQRPKPKDDGPDNEFYTVYVYKDLERNEEVVARFEHNHNITREVVVAHLEQLVWKGKNMLAQDGAKAGRIVLTIDVFENTSAFVENPDVPKTGEFIAELRKNFDNIIATLEGLGRERGELNQA